MQQMGVHCDLCDMHFHKSCPGKCDCDTTVINDGDLVMDLTTIEDGDDTEQGQ
jgi:hypothetical protein